MMHNYTIGVDFGTLSGRAVLVDTTTGEEVAVAVHEYSHGVMDEKLPDGTPLGVDWALQHPQDYLDVFRVTVPMVMKMSMVTPDQVVGVGIDFTACTVLPVKADGTPLCFLDEFRSRPNAWIKLWKHHAAQDEANRLNTIAEQRKEKFLKRYGGKISSEWMIPKIWQTVNEDPGVYDAADRFIEAADWVVWQLTGRETRNTCTAGYKAIWHKHDGYPSNEFFKALHPRMERLVDEKLLRTLMPVGTRAGSITAAAAGLTGLREGTAVAVANVDAHVSIPAVGITSPGKMLAIIGTSTCHMLLGDTEREVPGMCGVVEDGIIEGFFGYEAGQSCVGDHFQWFVENCTPAEYKAEADAAGIDLHTLLTEKAAKLKPGESGLVALDWWNGNRSVLVDVDLTGMIAGMSLITKPEEIYRALIEATAFGTRMIIETFEENGVPVNEFYAAGGIAEKNAFVMQIYADVIKREIRISGSPQAPALGSAMFGAVAAGKADGGFDTIMDAARVMAKVKEQTYRPIGENTAIYDRLFAEYRILHDYFGRGANDVMKRLKAIRKEVKG
ncbi:MAG: ribulokinase [Bacteroidales bacterium]|jgi:L-ribulokinase|nr:ribulokinase [Bacteroidales bacterium]MDX9927133.1 ribulokinase [Bacteroidales bacterium]HPS97151.1 ribulokinase [Bacteroidales bacterium]